MIAATLDAIAAATVQVRYENIGGTMRWHLTGQEDAVRAKVNELFRSHPTQGYGTTVEKRGAETVVTAYSCD